MTNSRPSRTPTCGTGGTDCDVVTGAFGYSGAAIAALLRAVGRQVRPLTNHPGRAPANTDIVVRPLNFDDPAELTASLRGAQATGTTRLTDWITGRGPDLGLSYVNEINRHYRSMKWHPDPSHAVRQRMCPAHLESAAASTWEDRHV